MERFAKISESDTTWIKQFSDNNSFMDIQDLIEKELSKKLNNTIDDIFIEGLALKGFFFMNKQDAVEFAKENCRCIDYTEFEEKVFYVYDIPFLLYDYKTTDFEWEKSFEATSITASCGSYAYL